LKGITPVHPKGCTPKAERIAAGDAVETIRVHGSASQIKVGTTFDHEGREELVLNVITGVPRGEPGDEPKPSMPCLERYPKIQPVQREESEPEAPPPCPPTRLVMQLEPPSARNPGGVIQEIVADGREIGSAQVKAGWCGQVAI
jgi:hypothetical protein